MTLHREGTTIILGSLITYLILSALNGIYIFPFSNILAYLIYTFLIVILVLVIQFFRIPKRTNIYPTIIRNGANVILLNEKISGLKTSEFSEPPPDIKISPNKTTTQPIIMNK